MKNNRNNRITIIVLVLMLAAATSGEAQFNSLLNKAKRTAKEKVDKTIREKTRDAKNEAVKQTKEVVAEKTGLPLTPNSKDAGKLKTLYKKKYKPSKEAIAAFPDAANNETWERSSKPFSQIYGAYEHLDPKYFPLQPYYKYPVMYGLGMDAVIGMNVLDDMIRTRLSNGFGSVTQFLPFVYSKENEELLTPAGEKMGVYHDDMFRYAYAAQFFADPNSDIAVERLAELVAYFSPTINSGIEIPYAENEGGGILDAAKGIMLPAPNYRQIRDEREQMMLELATEVVSIDLIADHVVKYLEKVEANDAFCQKDPSLRAKYLLMGTQLYERILTSHKDWKKKKSSTLATRATMLYTRYNQTDESLAVLRNVRSANVPAVAMPKGVSVSSTIKAKGDAAGRKLAADRGDEFVKVVYLEKTWRTFKQPKWPYKVMHYAINADLITKSGDKTVLTHCELHKSPDGRSYVMVVGKDAEKHPVK